MNREDFTMLSTELARWSHALVFITFTLGLLFFSIDDSELLLGLTKTLPIIELKLPLRLAVFVGASATVLMQAYVVWLSIQLQAVVHQKSHSLGLGPQPTGGYFHPVPRVVTLSAKGTPGHRPPADTIAGLMAWGGVAVLPVVLLAGAFLHFLPGRDIPVLVCAGVALILSLALAVRFFWLTTSLPKRVTIGRGKLLVLGSGITTSLALLGWAFTWGYVEGVQSGAFQVSPEFSGKYQYQSWWLEWRLTGVRLPMGSWVVDTWPRRKGISLEEFTMISQLGSDGQHGTTPHRLRRHALVNASLDGTSLDRLQGDGVWLAATSAREARFTGFEFLRSGAIASDLSHAEFTGATFHDSYLRLSRFDYATARDVDWRGAHIVKSSLIGADLGGQPSELWQGTRWNQVLACGASLVGVDLSQANLRRVDLRNADLRETVWPRTFEGDGHASAVNVQGADLRGADLRGADWYGREDALWNLPLARLDAWALRDMGLPDDMHLRLETRDLSGDVSLAGRNLRGANFRGWDLRGVDFTSANLRGANLSDARLKGAIFQDADLSYADMTGADLLEASGLTPAQLLLSRGWPFAEQSVIPRRDYVSEDSTFVLDWMDFRLLDLTEVHLAGASLIGADLSGAKLQGVSLVGADLSDANLSFVDLERADLKGARLVGTRLRYANLNGAELAPSAFAVSRADLRGISGSLGTGTPPHVRRRLARAATGERMRDRDELLDLYLSLSVSSAGALSPSGTPEDEHCRP